LTRNKNIQQDERVGVAVSETAERRTV